MKKLKHLEGACAVLALHYISGKSEETALRVCKMHDFHPGEGMDDEDWREAAEVLGIRVRAMPLESMRLKRFVTLHSEGLFLIGTHNHLFVVDSGVIVDPRTKTPGFGRIVKQAWRVYKN